MSRGLFACFIALKIKVKKSIILQIIFPRVERTLGFPEEF